MRGRAPCYNFQGTLEWRAASFGPWRASNADKRMRPYRYKPFSRLPEGKKDARARLLPSPLAGAAGEVPAPARRSVLQEPVLVLNSTYEPIHVTAVRRALILMLKGVAQME